MKAIVLLSGGLDSAVCLYLAIHKGYQVSALSVRYGQRHIRELRSARLLARAAGVRLHIQNLSLPWLRGSSLVNSSKKLPTAPLSRIGKNGIPSTYVPGRNTIFMGLALSLAEAIGAQAIYIGANLLDYSGYPDCRPAYDNALRKVAQLGTKRGVSGEPLNIETPLIGKNKAAIVRLALRLGVPVHLTWSCYRGGKNPCEQCDSCKLRAKGFLNAGAQDPTLCPS